MGFSPLRLESRMVLRRQLQRRPVIDRRRPALQLALAAPLELLGRLVAGIEQTLGLERRGGGRIAVETVGLLDRQMRPDAEPA